jgi:hypothetical protein
LHQGRWAPLLAANLLYALSVLMAALIFDVVLEPVGFLLDFVAFNILVLLLFLCSRRGWVCVLLLALLTGVFVVGSAAKIALLGRPIMPEDVHSVAALVRIMGPMGWLIVALPLGLTLLLLIGNLRVNSRASAAALLVLCLAPLAVAPVATEALRLADRHIGNAPWDQRQNFVERGPTLHMLQETLRAYALIQPPPGEADVAEAIDRLRGAAGAFANELVQTSATPVTYRPAPQRNVHVLLLESFWDPTPLLDPQKPILDPRFYALWDQTGRSTALSPTFSGGTANAEFEVLCGFPIDSWAVKYELGFNQAPCLPALLRDQGYRTLASHPNDAGFWNRVNAYPRLGFDAFWSKPDFIPDEMISWMLSDRSLYRQIAEKIAAEDSGAPVFNFVVTLYGHWTYDMVPERPAIVPIDPAQVELGQFATAMYYKSVELMDEIERLRVADPDALIVAFGDHLPNLGYNWGGYKNHGFFQGGWGDFPAAMYLKSRETPLLVIDGRNGPQAVGHQPLFRLNHLIRDRLQLDQPAIADLAPLPDGLNLRPVPDSLLGLDASGAPFLCKPEQRQGDCAAAADWLADVKLISRDLFDGEGHALSLLGAVRHPVTAAAQ